MSTDQQALIDKKDATLKFFLFGNVMPLIIPLLILLGYNQYMRGVFPINCFILNIIMLMPVLVLTSYYLYDKVIERQTKLTKLGIKLTEKRIDYLLYATAAITMCLIGWQVNSTGGYDNSILIFYFYYIPSAIAISFKKAKIGLWLTIIISIGALIYNYHSKPEITETLNGCMNSYKIIYSSIIVLHLVSLGILEKTNKD